MTRREKELERALASFDRTGDDELDSMVDTADDLTRHFAMPSPAFPRDRAMFIEGVGARRRSIVSSLAIPAMAVVILLLTLIMLGGRALPGDPLYPVRDVLRSAGLASAPTTDLLAQLEDAELLISKARSAFDRGSDNIERFAIEALMSLGRAEGYLEDIDEADRAGYEVRIDLLRVKAVALLRLDNSLNDDGDSDRSGSDDSSDGDNSGPGSDDSGSDDSGSGDESGSGNDSVGDDSGGDNSGSGSDDSDTNDSGSGSDDSDTDNSGSGSDDSDSDHDNNLDDRADDREEGLDD